MFTTDWNCNHFTDECVFFLTGTHLPSYIRGAQIYDSTGDCHCLRAERRLLVGRPEDKARLLSAPCLRRPILEAAHHICGARVAMSAEALALALVAASVCAPSPLRDVVGYLALVSPHRSRIVSTLDLE